LSAGRILAALDSFRLLTQSRDSKSSGQGLFHMFRRLAQNQPRSNLVFLVRVAHDGWLRGTELHFSRAAREPAGTEVTRELAEIQSARFAVVTRSLECVEPLSH